MKQDICHRICLSVASLCCLCAAEAHANGTAAGTIITNTATGSLTYGGITSVVQSNTVSVRVDEILDVAVSPLAGSTTQLSATTTAVVPFRITNAGNGPEAFKITATGVAGSQFTPTVTALVLDTNGNKTYDPGVDQPLLTNGTTAQIAANGTIDAYAIISLPAGATDGQTAQLKLTAEAATGSGSPRTVFAGKGSGGGDAVVGATGALTFATSQLSASAISLAITKTASVVDPYGHTNVVPGSIITFQLNANFVGSGTATLAHVTDVIPAGTTYQSGSLRLDNTTLTDAADGDAGVASASGIDVTFNSITGGVTRVIKFDVKVN